MDELWWVGVVCVVDLVCEFGVVEFMICCDIGVLVDCGLFMRVYGGVMLCSVFDIVVVWGGLVVLRFWIGMVVLLLSYYWF